MKTITAAAILMMVAVPAWADDSEKQTNDPANSNEQIVLSEAEMDGVTAGYLRVELKNVQITSFEISGNADDRPTGQVFQSYALYPHMYD